MSYKRIDLVLDIEIIPDDRAKPFVPEKGPKDRSEPWDKLMFDSNFNKICCIGFRNKSKTFATGLDEYAEQSEAAMLKYAWEIIGNADRIITFNGLSFDIPFLLKRSWYNNVIPKLNISLQRYQLNTNHLDLRAVLSNWDSYAKGSLDLYAQLKLGKGKTNGMDGSKVASMWEAGEYTAVKEYCMQDCEITWELFQDIKRSQIWNIMD